MKIDFAALSRMTGAATGVSETPQAQDEATPPPIIAPAQPPRPISARYQADSDGVIPDPHAEQAEPHAVRFSAAPPDAPAPASTQPKPKLWAWKRKKPTAGQNAAESPAKKINQGRYAIMGAIVFAVGIVVAPWFANQATQPEPDKPMGPNAAAVVASTLTNSALGVQLPTGEADPNASPTTYTPAAQAQAQVDIPLSGEARYTAMLGAIKNIPAEPIVPAISVRHTPSASGAGLTQQPERAVVKRIVPVPLRMETGSDAQADAPEDEPVAHYAKASELYKVVRIDRNRVGELVAYIAPIGGREATQGSWAFVGDTTSGGFYIEGITQYHVLLRSPNGRVQHLTP